MLTGKLEGFGLIDVLSLIKKDRKSCILTVEYSDENSLYVVVYFKDGDPLFIRFLKKSFMVYLDLDFDSILRKEGLTKQDLLKILVERIQVLLSLKKGSFSITSGFVKFPPDIKPELNAEKLIMALSRGLSKEEVDRKINDDKMVFEKTEEAMFIAERSSLTDWEEYVLRIIDGLKTLSEIESKVLLEEMLRRTVTNPEELKEEVKLAFRRAVYGLLNAGIVKQKLRIKKQDNVFDRIIQLLDLRTQKKLEV